MKSKSTSMILGGIILIVVIGLIYFFVFRKESAQPAPKLVSSTTGQQQLVVTNSSTGNQVIEILRNLTAIRLDDAVFRNPALNQLSDMRVTIPQVTDQGRRNPFAAFGVN